jgi:hypothetical protein
MVAEIVDVDKVINIVDHHFELLLLLKLVGHVETLYPFGIKTVHNHLCLS